MAGTILIIALSVAGILLLRSLSKRVSKTQSSAFDFSMPKPLDTLFDKLDTTPDSPVAFGYKMSWLAIHTSDARAVTNFLPIENLQVANWQTGIIAAYNGHTFITPAVQGWTFVVSHQLPELGIESYAHVLLTLLSELSTEFGEAQYFCTHRVSDYNAWSLFKNGREIRSFSYFEDILIDHGKKSDTENELGYHYFTSSSPEANSDAYWEREDLCFPNEEHVMEVAGKWSVNPQTLSELSTNKGTGWIGNLIQKII